MYYLKKKTILHPLPPPASLLPPSIARPIAGELQQWPSCARPGTGELPEQSLRVRISMCVVKSNKNGPENSPTKPPAREPEAAGAAGAPRRPPRDLETAGAAGAAAGTGATFLGPEMSVGAIRRRGRPAGEGEGAAAGTEAASRAGEKGSAAAAAAMAAATEAALACGPVNS